jgi:hypothetical protein
VRLLGEVEHLIDEHYHGIFDEFNKKHLEMVDNAFGTLT